MEIANGDSYSATSVTPRSQPKICGKQADGGKSEEPRCKISHRNREGAKNRNGQHERNNQEPVRPRNSAKTSPVSPLGPAGSALHAGTSILHIGIILLTNQDVGAALP